MISTMAVALALVLSVAFGASDIAPGRPEGERSDGHSGRSTRSGRASFPRPDYLRACARLELIAGGKGCQLA